MRVEHLVGVPLAETAYAGSVEPDQANTCEGKQEENILYGIVPSFA